MNRESSWSSSVSNLRERFSSKERTAALFGLVLAGTVGTVGGLTTLGGEDEAKLDLTTAEDTTTSSQLPGVTTTIPIETTTTALQVVETTTSIAEATTTTTEAPLSPAIYEPTANEFLVGRFDCGEENWSVVFTPDEANPSGGSTDAVVVQDNEVYRFGLEERGIGTWFYDQSEEGYTNIVADDIICTGD